MAPITTLLLIISLSAWALPLKFQKSAHFYFGGFELDGKKQATSFDCKTYGFSPQAPKDIVLNLEAPMNFTFEFDCRGDEVGSFINLDVVRSKKPLTSVERIMHSGGDESYSGTSHMWLEDLNNDGFVDLVTRYKARDSVDNGETSYLKSDELEVYHWAKGTFKKQAPKAKDLTTLLKKFDFQFKI